MVTRTRERPLLLDRVRAHLEAQSRRDFEWVVYNDGGDPDAVEQVAERARKGGLTMRVLHNASSQGIEAASNAAIRTCETEYVAIHDDDDTWEPRYLERMLGFMDLEPLYEGVVCHTLYVEEELRGDVCRTIASHPFEPHVESVHLSEMAQRNLFPPIAFLYRRRIFDEVGGYDESLPVLGDWDFNLRFLLRADIGVLPEYLAGYHHRVTVAPEQESYGSTMVQGRGVHGRYNVVLRNRYLRRDLESGRPGLGALVTAGQYFRSLHDRLDERLASPSTPDPTIAWLRALARDLRRLARRIRRSGA